MKHKVELHFEFSDVAWQAAQAAARVFARQVDWTPDQALRRTVLSACWMILQDESIGNATDDRVTVVLRRPPGPRQGLAALACGPVDDDDDCDIVWRDADETASVGPISRDPIAGWQNRKPDEHESGTDR